MKKSQPFCISNSARAELLSRLAKWNGTAVCQFCLVHLEPDADPGGIAETRNIDPIDGLMDALGLAPEERRLRRLDIGILPRSGVPEDEIQDLAGVPIQLNEFWRKQLAGFELNYDRRFFLVEQ
jgi:hypothetical protein